MFLRVKYSARLDGSGIFESEVFSKVRGSGVFERYDSRASLIRSKSSIIHAHTEKYLLNLVKPNQI